MYNNGKDVSGNRYTKFTGSFGAPKAIAQLRLEYENGQVNTSARMRMHRCRTNDFL